MVAELGRIGPITIRTYTLLLDAAVIAALIMLAVAGNRRGRRAIDWLDAGLAALVGGLLGARAAHVLIYWPYFSGHLDETYRVWLGGLNWHGAVLGGLLALWLYTRLRPVPFRALGDALAPLLVVGMLAASLGCYASGCGYGVEVPSLAGYPPLIAAEQADLYGVVAPRLNSPGFSTAAGVVILTAVFGLRALIRKEGALVWIALALIGLAQFGIGFTRGDEVPPLGTLRLDQMFDLLMLGLGLIGAVVALLPGRSQHGEDPRLTIPERRTG